MGLARSAEYASASAVLVCSRMPSRRRSRPRI